MLIRIATVAVCIAAAMAAAKDGRVIRSAGLTAACTVVQERADGTQVDACHPGRLEGRPDLSNRGCIDAGIAGTVEYWHCPASTASAPLP